MFKKKTNLQEFDLHIHAEFFYFKEYSFNIIVNII